MLNYISDTFHSTATACHVPRYVVSSLSFSETMCPVAAPGCLAPLPSIPLFYPISSSPIPSPPIPFSLVPFEVKALEVCSLKSS